jgi:beta-N-acetylhexosaminidase
MSEKFLQDILRKRINFGGVVISDDMQMAAITDNYSFEDSIIKAINAGCDILVFSNNMRMGYDSSLAYKVSGVIFDAVKNNKIGAQRIDDSYERIINLKKKFKIIK